MCSPRYWQQLATSAAAVFFTATSLATQSNPSVERLRPVEALPAHLCGQLREPVGFAQTPAGQYIVLDRRQHTVSTVDKARTKLTTLMRAGMEKGNVLQPAALSVSGEAFAVTDAPYGQDRVQLYFSSGGLLSAFLLPGIAAPRLAIDGIILNGAGSLFFTGKHLLVNRPESGSLVWVLNLEGQAVNQIGSLRRTGHEADRDVHLALNVGLPLGTPDGGVIFVFQTGAPMFRKYAADGTLEFERHIEGPALDGYIQAQPTTWPTRKVGDGTYPLVPPVVRTAAVSPNGDLWVSLIPMVTYVYNAAGDKVRTVQFDATGPFAPASFFFSKASGSTRLLVTPGCYEYEPG
jgi:hypothetical protein